MASSASGSIASSSRPSRLAVFVALLALAAAAVALLSSFGTRWEWWHFRTGFTMLRWAAYSGIAVALLSLVALYRTRPGAPPRGFPLALFALILALATFVVPWQVQRMGQRLPPIHDITTAPENPPEFVAIAPLRSDAPNPTEYGGPDIAAQQREAYPDIQPLHLTVAPQQAFDTALAAAREMGWSIVDADSAALRIEAVDETFWYGFKDDIVVRLSPADGGSVLDARSVSRVGRGDLGVNARRIRAYLDEVEGRI